MAHKINREYIKQRKLYLIRHNNQLDIYDFWRKEEQA